MASRGLRDIGDGTEKIIDPESVAEAKKQARRAKILTLATAAVATAALLIPN